MDLLAIGTQVTIDGDIPAVIRGITIYSEHWIKYLCVWWDGRQRRDDWFSDDEFQVRDPQHTAVRFK